MSKPKQKLFVDFDNTIVNATKSFCQQYNKLFRDQDNIIPAQWELVDRYDFRDQCTLVQKENVEEIFKMQSFFNDLEFINPNTYDILEELNSKYEIIIASIGTYKNISLKSIWVNKHLPFIQNSIFIINQGCKMDKSVINMNDAILIDDVTNNLESSNAETKICFGTIHQWNKNWEGVHCLNWTEVIKKLAYKSW